MKVEIKDLCLAVANYMLIQARGNNTINLVDYLNEEFGTNLKSAGADTNEILLEFIEKNCKYGVDIRSEV